MSGIRDRLTAAIQANADILIDRVLLNLEICPDKLGMWNLRATCVNEKYPEVCCRCWTGALEWAGKDVRREAQTEPEPEPEPVESLNNFAACLNPPQWADKKDCPGCKHYGGCVWPGREQYRRPKQ